MPTIDFEKIPIKDMALPPTSKQTISFLQLPREIRNPIYQESIVAGNVAILRLNKLVHEEASELLAKYATLRIHLGFANRRNWSGLSSSCVTPVAQHVDLRINARPEAFPFDATAITGLLLKPVARESCIVTIDYVKAQGRKDFVCRPLYRLLAHHGCFKRLVFKIVYARDEPEERRVMIAKKNYDEVFYYHYIGQPDVWIGLQEDIVYGLERAEANKWALP